MGDSAGGNLAAAVCLMARTKRTAAETDFDLSGGEFLLHREITVQIRENQWNRIPSDQCQNGRLCNSVSADRRRPQNPYFAPVLAENLQGLPDTLVLTAQYDPLRDEGEDYAKKLKRAGNLVEHHRIKGALHGYFALGIEHLYVQESFQYMNAFLRKEKQQKNADEELENIAAVKKQLTHGKA